MALFVMLRMVMVLSGLNMTALGEVMDKKWESSSEMIENLLKCIEDRLINPSHVSL